MNNPLYSLVITEIMPKPADGDEWIELYNETMEEVNLKDWRIIDASGKEGVLSPVNVILERGKYIAIAKNSETVALLNLEPSVEFLIPDRWPALNNDGDRLELVDSDGIVIDKMEYLSEACKVAGRSWERIDPLSSGMDYHNWGPCADPSGHTAGRPNSLRVASPGTDVEIRVEPNPFNPYRGENVTIFFNLPVSTSRITVEVYNTAGYKLRRLTDNLPAGPDSPRLYWDGRNNNGRLMPVGRYIVFAQALDSRVGRVYSAKCTVVLADKLR